ncbi:MAG: four helix bundle protein [Candidatus Sungbacteria bacterium]|uniref:Four helix bundle protein n=1 Tax=Candidatus Sungiibacteriota bacterium TaxID=2750080 RepID=A0A9D6LSG3_9BACT|nr:four helix bundle protein [Candidatus Sungbacteria bacterium]
MNKELRIMENRKIENFKDLEARKKGQAFVLNIYQVTKQFPKEEQFGLIAQLRRAGVSITSNIAEGFSRRSYREKSQFYAIALGSLTEVQSQLLSARDIGYLDPDINNALDSAGVEIHKIINGLIKSSFILYS